MFKINDHLYLGKAKDINLLLDSHYNLIVIGSPDELDLSGEDRQRFEQLLRSSKTTSTRHVQLFHLENEEIPHYKVSQFKTILKELDAIALTNDTVIISRNGESRGPSIALLWMAFHVRSISKSSFAAARMDFSRLYPQYIPWPGIVIFFNQEWDAIVGSPSKVKLNL